MSGFTCITPISAYSNKQKTRCCTASGYIAVRGAATTGIDPVAGLWLKVDVPEASNSPGEQGQYSYDEEYFYVCIDTSTWRRWPILDWE